MSGNGYKANILFRNLYSFWLGTCNDDFKYKVWITFIGIVTFTFFLIISFCIFICFINSFHYLFLLRNNLHNEFSRFFVVTKSYGFIFRNKVLEFLGTSWGWVLGKWLGVNFACDNTITSICSLDFNFNFFLIIQSFDFCCIKSNSSWEIFI